MPPRTATAALAALLAALLGGGTAAAAGPPAPATASAATTSAAATALPARTPAVVVRPARSSVRASLGSRISSALAGSTARTVSVAVDVDGLGGVLRRDAAHALPPASTQKTWVVATALLALGGDSRQRTEVAATATATAGVLPGSLWLVAGGDPYLTTSGLTSLARSVRAAGVTVVAGDLRLDDSRYDGLRRAPGWKRRWVPNELGPLSALAVDRNRGRRDAAYLADPTLPNTVRFRDLLRAEGVTVKGAVRRERRPAAAVTVAQRESASLATNSARLLKASDNFAAELLLKEVGRVVMGAGSSRAGLAGVAEVLGEHGVRVGRGADGSGLSSVDRQTTSGQVAMLRAVGASAAGPGLRAALPVACVDGTLRRRLCRTVAAGNVRAKTGTLSGVTALAGYATTRSGRPARFAIQLSGVRDAARARAAIDRAVVVLAGSTD